MVSKNDKGFNRERGITMRVANLMEVETMIAERQKSLRTDETLYRNEDQLAAEVARWGIELLDQIKDEIHKLSFEATISQYKTPRTGE